MKRIFTYIGLLGVVITMMVTAAALWYARSLLPGVGVVIIVLACSVFVLGLLIALARALLWLRGILLNQQVIHRGEVVVLKQGNTILHLSAMHNAATVSPTIVTSTPPVQPHIALPMPGVMLPQAPSFASIAQQITPGHLILGFNAEGAIYGDVSDLLSMGVVGKPGTGKSSALLYYLTMLVLSGSQVCVLDPHGSLNELADYINYSDDVSDIAAMVPSLHHEIDERLTLWKSTKRVKTPLLVLIDELPVIARHEQKSKPQYSVLELVERIVLEARKLNCFVILSGQSLPADVLPTLTRDNLSSRIVFNSSDAHARMAGLDEVSRKKFLPLLKRAQPGTAILDVSRRSEPDIVALPYTTIDDLRDAVNGNSWERSHSVPLRSSSVPQPVEAFPLFPVPVQERLGTPDFRVPEEEREQIISLLVAGVPRRDMCAQLGKGKSYYCPHPSQGGNLITTMCAQLGKGKSYYPIIKGVLDEYEQGA